MKLKKQTMGHSRTQLDFNIEVYRLFKMQSEAKKLSLPKYLHQLCTEITNGKYDSLIKAPSPLKQVSIYKEDVQAVKEHLKGSGDNVTNMLKKVALEKEKEANNE